MINCSLHLKGIARGSERTQERLRSKLLGAVSAVQDRALSVRAWETRSEESWPLPVLCGKKSRRRRSTKRRRRGASWGSEEPGGPERRGPWGCEESETPRDLLETRHGAHSYHGPFQGGSVLLCRAFILLRGCPGLGGERNPSGQQ